MELDLKPIEKRDIETLCDWHKEHVAINFPDSKYKRDKFRKLLLTDLKSTQSSLLKLTDGEKIIGFLWLKRLRDEYKDIFYCDLHYIHISPEYRGKGWGKALMYEAERWAKEHKCKEIRLGTDANNLASISLYLKCGYIQKRILFEKKLCQPPSKSKNTLRKK